MFGNRISIGLFFLFILNSASAFQAGSPTTTPVLVVNASEQGQNVNAYSKVFQTADTLSASEAWARISRGEMAKSYFQANPGMTNSDQAFWVLFTLKSELNLADEFVLYVDYPQLDQVGLFSVKENGTVTDLYITGDQFPFSQRPYEHRNFVFPIRLAAGETHSFLLNADKRSSAIRFPITVYEREVFEQRTDKNGLLLAVYYIFILLISLGAVLFGFGLKRKVFFLYALSVVTYGLWVFTWQGFSYQYITSNFPVFNRHLLPIISQAAIISLLIFVQVFFNTKTLLPRFNKLMNGVLIILLLSYGVWAAIPSTFISVAPKLFAIRYCLVLSIMVFAVAAVWKFRKIEKSRSVIFAVSYAFFFMGILGKILAEYGVIVDFNFVFNPLMIGYLMQVIVLSGAMVMIVMKIMKERDELQQYNLSLQESLVALKTREANTKKMKYLTLKSKALLLIEHLKYIKSDGAYLEFYLEERAQPESDRQALASLKPTLPTQFVQIHRSLIVNLDFVKEVKSTFLTLHDGTELPVSRKYKEELNEALGKRINK